MLEQLLHPRVIDRVEERANVGVEHPAHLLAVDCHSDCVERSMLRPARPEAIREPDEFALFVDRLHQHPRCLLDDFVFQRRDPERPWFPVGLWDVHASYRLRMVVAAMNAAFEIEQPRVEILAVRMPGLSVDPWSRILPKALVRLLQ